MSNAYENWIGREERTTGYLDGWQAEALAATLDMAPWQSGRDSALPLSWQWIFFRPVTPRHRVAADGHPPKGGLLPPVTLPRRMFAGARMEQLTPLMPDAPAERLERIAAIKQKAGRSGEFVIVTLETNYSQHGQLCVREERDIVYRDAPRSNQPEPGQDVKKRLPPAASLALDLIPDPVLLFRFSALTFNSHRIHYDRDYAMSTEGYSDLVVHGPLSAVLLAELVRKHSKMPIRDFSFRAVRPLFANRPLHLRGEFHDGSFALAAYDDHGFLAVEAQAGLGVS